MFTSNFVSSIVSALNSVNNSLAVNYSKLDEMPESKTYLSAKAKYLVTVLDCHDGIVNKQHVRSVWSEMPARVQCSIHNNGLLVSFIEPTPSGYGCYKS